MNRSKLEVFANESKKFCVNMDHWIQRFGQESHTSGLSRTDALQARTELERIERALRWGPSVGVYGESQCGKSNLVSRFAQGLGAKAAEDGGLLISDPSPQANHAWQGENGIDFAKHINPVNSKESTGIICRFTSNQPIGVEPGCFQVEFMSHADLLCSLALGYNAEIKEKNVDTRKDRIKDVLDKLEKKEKELDNDGTMAELLEAWDFLRETTGQGDLFKALDNDGNFGWDEFVNKCLVEGKRPKWKKGNSEEPCDLEEFIGLLWDSVAPMNQLWRKLYRQWLKLGGMRTASIAPEFVCKDSNKSSLVSIDHIDKLYDETSNKCLIKGKNGNQDIEVSLAVSVIVALARELILPVGKNEIENTSEFDVLDYPGALNEERNRDLEQEDKQAENVLVALKRGKINRLFISAVKYYDASILCLAVSSEGNQTSGAPIQRALRAWLEREDWNPKKYLNRFDQEEQNENSTESIFCPQSLVVALTKSDTIFTKTDIAIENTIIEMTKKYSNTLPWMEKWDEQKPFKNIFPVHNPSAHGASLKDMDENKRKKIVDICAQQPHILKHIEMPRYRLNALAGLAPSGESADVTLLMEHIKKTIESVRDKRLVNLTQRALDIVKSIIDKIQVIYIGPGDKRKVDQEKKLALEHVQALRNALKKTQSVSDLLRALDVPITNIKMAWRATQKKLVSEDEEGSGAVTFEDFYPNLVSAFGKHFVRKFSDAKSLKNQLKTLDGRNVYTEIQSHFHILPTAKWFRDSIQESIRPLLEAYDSAAMPLEALASIVHVVWNRNMVWLGQVLDAPMHPKHLPPKLRPQKAASSLILDHWQNRLPEVYATLVDPERCTQKSNLKLGDLRKEILQTLQKLLKEINDQPTNDNESWAKLTTEVSGLEKLLSEPSFNGSVLPTSIS